MKKQTKIQKKLEKLLQLHDHEKIELGLSRIRKLTSKLSNPQDKLKIISLVGSNGKGSVGSFLFSILGDANYSCDLFSSPSVQRINERFIFSGNEVTDEKLCKLVEEVQFVNNNDPISYFEILTAVFFLGASRASSDISILESGLFYSRDASACIKQNLASVVTAIGIDHLDWLPPNQRNLDRIIFEKTSKLLNSKIIVSEQSSDLIMKKIKKNLSDNLSEKYFFNDFYSYQILDKKTFLYKDKLGSLELPKPSLLGDHQVSNAATAIATIRNLENYKVKTENIVNGLKNAKNIGRLEQLKNGRLKKLAPTNTIYLDACHNELGAVACAKFIETLNTPVNLILAMMKNKEHKNFISKFKNKINSVQVCSIPNNPNCIEKENLNQIVLKAGIKSEIANSIEDAVKKLAQKDPASVIMVCGSIYFLGEILNLNS